MHGQVEQLTMEMDT